MTRRRIKANNAPTVEVTQEKFNEIAQHLSALSDDDEEEIRIVNEKTRGCLRIYVRSIAVEKC